MKISTRGRYALRVMVELADRGKEYTAMKEIAAAQSISLKYLEKILPLLVKNGFIEGTCGKGGGYRLCRDAKEYRVSEILKVTEKDLSPVTCLCSGAEPCQRAAECRTLPLWTGLRNAINAYLDSVTLQDIADGRISASDTDTFI